MTRYSCEFPALFAVLIGVVVGVFVFLANHESPAAIGSECSHVFDKWTDLEPTHDWNYGPRFWQSRTCNSCGYAQLRNVTP